MRPAELEELLQKLESNRRELVHQVEEMTEEEAGRRPAESEWSAKEQLVHLAAFERLWLEWAMKVRDEPGCVVGPPSPNPPAYPEAEARSVADLLRELASARASTVAAIDGLTDDELKRRGKHLLFGEMSVLQMLRSLYRHDRMHMDQMAGREASFRPGAPGGPRI
ncbi:MAG: DinB family protein [Dehalococcoidia bacterium]|nr:DinB family protein [Dehalococcoidia bacterium]